MRRRHVAVLAAALCLGLVAPASGTFSQVESIPEAAAVSKANRTVLRVATFNVRTARARGDSRRWLTRAPDVAREILSRRPGVVALQELGPGRADGKKGKTKGHIRQTTSLTTTLKRLGGGRYRLVRWSGYVKPGTRHGTQGTRILYDSSRYALASRCPQSTRGKAYNGSCAFDLPIASGDSRRLRRAVAYAKLRDRRTGRQFYVVSAHLDPRHSGNNRREARYNALRARQAAHIARVMARVNSSRLPVVFGGDINSWQTDRGRYAPHRVLVSRGFRDAASARKRINSAYPTVNHWRTRVVAASRGSGNRLDVVMVKRGKGFLRYENKVARVDRARPSDHNMVVADVVL